MGKKISKEERLRQFEEIHKDKYDYSKFEYHGVDEKSIFICKTHGEFEQNVWNHLKGHGCAKCRNEDSKLRMTKSHEDFIKEAAIKHENKYDYSLCIYEASKKKVLINCPKHGGFFQTPGSHLNGNGCPKCGLELIAISRRISSEHFIENARKVHGERYDYSSLKYFDHDTKVEIKCRDHGSFYQNPISHLIGKGCPRCRKSKGEEMVRQILELSNIVFETQKSFDSLLSEKGGNLLFDFFIPQYNLLIEFDGWQHKNFLKWFHKTYDNFERSQKRDETKNNWAKDNKYNLIRLDKIDEKYMIDKLSLFIPSLKSHTTDGGKVETP